MPSCSIQPILVNSTILQHNESAFLNLKITITVYPLTLINKYLHLSVSGGSIINDIYLHHNINILR